MSVPAAYLGIVLIWATTPLAIKWSNDGSDFMLAISSRMSLGFVFCVLLLLLFRIPMRWDRDALKSYAAAGLGMFGAMMSVYWAAQYISSGLISVLYGLTPMVIGLFAALWLDEPFFSPSKMVGLLLAVVGLGEIFLPEGAGASISAYGVLGVLVSVLFHSWSSVWVKRIGAHMHPLALNCGALALAVPLYVVCWLAFGADVPEQLPQHTLGAILYLAVIGTALGFNLYFYVLKRVSAMLIGLITLITPVLALLLGQALNGEQTGINVWIGTAVILAGLGLFLWGGRLYRVFATIKR
jgi:drug/metabolite transporter (DMT)-like permease